MLPTGECRIYIACGLICGRNLSYHCMPCPGPGGTVAPVESRSLCSHGHCAVTVTVKSLCSHKSRSLRSRWDCKGAVPAQPVILILKPDPAPSLHLRSSSVTAPPISVLMRFYAHACLMSTHRAPAGASAVTTGLRGPAGWLSRPAANDAGRACRAAAPSTPGSFFSAQ